MCARVARPALLRGPSTSPLAAMSRPVGLLPDFAVRYRYLGPAAGIRPPYLQQHTRMEFLYDGDDPQRDGCWIIWPEFLDEDGKPWPKGPVPNEGTAHMFILNPDLRSLHRGRIRVGTKGYMVYGSIKATECEVIEVLALAGTHGS